MNKASFLLLLVLGQCFFMEFAEGESKGAIMAKLSAAKRKRNEEEQKKVESLVAMEKKMDKSKPCVDSEFAVAGQGMTINCFPSKAKEDMFYRLVAGRSVDFHWMVHESITKERMFIDRYMKLNILNTTTLDTGPLECHATLHSLNKQGTVTDTKTKVFKHHLMVVKIPQFSSVVQFSHPMSACRQESPRVEKLIQDVHERSCGKHGPKCSIAVTAECIGDKVMLDIRGVTWTPPIDNDRYDEAAWDHVAYLFGRKTKDNAQEIMNNLKMNVRLWEKMKVEDIPHAIVLCPQGYTFDGESKCAPCAPGMYSEDGFSCRACPKGRFQARYASNHCEFCPRGAPLFYTGASTEDECYSSVIEQPHYLPGSCVYWQDDVQYTLNPSMNNLAVVRVDREETRKVPNAQEQSLQDKIQDLEQQLAAKKAGLGDVGIQVPTKKKPMPTMIPKTIKPRPMIPPAEPPPDVPFGPMNVNRAPVGYQPMGYKPPRVGGGSQAEPDVPFGPMNVNRAPVGYQPTGYRPHRVGGGSRITSNHGYNGPSGNPDPLNAMGFNPPDALYRPIGSPPRTGGAPRMAMGYGRFNERGANPNSVNGVAPKISNHKVRNVNNGPQNAYNGPQNAYNGPQNAYNGPQNAYNGPQNAYNGGPRMANPANRRMGNAPNAWQYE